MMAVLLLRSLLVFAGLVAVHSSLLGARECTYGPSYWCSSIKTAKQCSAVNHCIQTVWEKLELPADNDDVCSICKDMVQQARDVLQSNETQMEIKQVFDGSCALIPLRTVANECKKLAEDFIPELIETLSSQMNPQIVCATAGLCNSVHVDLLLKNHGMPVDRSSQAVAVKGGEVCNDCTNFVNDVITTAQQSSVQEVMSRLLRICGQLGPVSSGCSSLVTENINIIYDFLTQQLKASDVCDTFGMCEAVKNVKISGKVNDEPCDFCVAIAQHWRDTLISNSTEHQVREVLDGICSKTGSFTDECKSLVDKYFKAVYEYLVRDFDPKEVCAVFGMCSTDFHNRAAWSFLYTGDEPADAIDNSVQELVPSLTFVGNDENNSYNMAPKPKIDIRVSVDGETGVLNVKGKEACTMCEFTLHFIQIQLQDWHTKKEIEDGVKSICSHLPKDVMEQCDDYVDAYGDQVIALLQQEIDPSILCPMLGLCPQHETTASLPNKDDVTCVGCEFIMKKLKDMLSDQTNEEQIKNALDRVCSVLPKSLSGECQTFIDQNAIEVMHLLAAGVDPEQVCRMLGLCKNVMVLSPLNESHQLPVSRMFAANPLLIPSPRQETESTGVVDLNKVGQTKLCVLCEFVIKTFEKFILDSDTHVMEKIQKALDYVCLHIPSTLQEDCLGFVDQYTTSIIELLVNKAKPYTLCSDLHLCHAPKLHTMAVLAEAQEPLSDERSCLICKAVAQTAARDEQLLLGATSHHEAVRALCDNIRSFGERDFCLRLQNHQFTKHTSPAAQCEALQHCPTTQGHQLIGSNRCTWGPSYWCQSLVHSQSCGATPHCQERQWEEGNIPLL